jgi:hypothetical protein
MPIAVSEKNSMKLPSTRRIMLVLPIHKSREAALHLASAYVAIKGNMAVNREMFTPARSDMRNPV